MKSTILKIIALVLFLVFVVLVQGCAKDHLTMERDGVKVSVDIEYWFQKKSFKSLEYDFMTGKVKITNFGSDTSESLETISKLLLGAGIGVGTGTGVGIVPP